MGIRKNSLPIPSKPVLINEQFVSQVLLVIDFSNEFVTIVVLKVKKKTFHVYIDNWFN